MLEQLWRRHRARSSSSSSESTRADAANDGRRFVQAHGVTYPSSSTRTRTSPSNRYAVPGLPVTYVLNPQGRIVGNPVLGPVSDKGYSEEFTRELKAALKS